MSRTTEYRCNHCNREVRANSNIVPGVSGWCLTVDGWTSSLSSFDSGIYICNKCLVTLIDNKKKQL